MSFGREDAICELDVIMQILPGSSDNKFLINASAVICNIADGRAHGWEVRLTGAWGVILS